MFSPCDISDGNLGFVVPAPFSAVMELSGNRAYLRRAAIAQRLGNKSLACYDKSGAVLCVAMFKQWRARRIEMALMIGKKAVAHLLELVRYGQEMLSQIVLSGLMVFAHIHPLNKQGQRLARLVGFKPGAFKDRSIWIHKG